MATKPVEIEILMRDRLSGGLDKAGRKVDELKVKTGSASAEMARLDRQAESVRGTVSKIAGAFAVKELVSNIVKVRGEFQQLEASFNTMLGSEEKADALMQQLIRTAATTPFDLQSVAGGARQLLAYGENVENVNEDLIRLGNIAAGLNQPLSDLIYLYGTTMTQGRLYTADYNQFVGRGIPLGRELADILGVAEGKVREMVEAGKVGFPEVQQALQNLTNEGGMFYNLMEEQSKTITGRISNIEDSVSMMMNEIGRQSEGIIGNSLDAVAYLVDHYEQVGRVLLGLVGTYGAYKTAVMAVTAMQALQTAGVGALTVAETLHYGWLVIVEKAQKLLNATMLANPYVLVATLVAGVVAAMVSMKTETERLKEAEEEYQAAKQKTIEAEEEHRRRLEELCGVAGDESLATETRREALNKLEQKYPDIFAKYDTEYEKLKNIKRIKEEIAELEAGQSITRPQNELDSVNKRISELERKKATERWVETNASGTSMKKEGGLTTKEESELQNLQAKRKSLSEQVRKVQANAYFENLTGISNDTLEEQIRQRENLLARMTTGQKKYGTITYGAEVLRGTYNRDELQYQLNKLNAEKNRRNQKRDSSADWGAQARKEYEMALKAYNDFLADTSNSLTQEDYEKKAKDLKDALSLAKKEYDRYKPEGNKDADSEYKAADKAEQEAERRRQAQQKLNDDLTALQQQNQQDELSLMEEGTEKKLAQIDADYDKRKAEIDKKARELADTNRKAGVTGTNASGLTKEQQEEIDRANELNTENRRKQTVEAYEAETQSMREYLRQYGTYQQQKLAIAEEYAEKIRNAQNEGERLSLTAERNRSLQQVEINAIRQQIDWGSVFGDFGTMFKEQLQPTIDRLRQIAQSDTFRQTGLEDQKTLYELIDKLEQSNAAWDSDIFKRVSNDIKAYQQAMQDYARAVENAKKAENDYVNAQKAHDAAIRTGNSGLIQATQAAVEETKSAYTAASEQVKTFGTEVQQTTTDLNSSAAQAKSMFESLASGLQGLSSGSLQGIGDGVMQLDRLFSGGELAKNVGNAIAKGFQSLLGEDSKAAQALTEALGDSGLAGEIISAILSILDILAQGGVGGIVSSLADTVLGSVNGILDDIFSGGIITKPLQSVVDGIGGIFDTITFGGFSSWLSSSNAKEVQATIDRLADRNEALRQSIEDLTDTIKGGEGTRSVAAYQQAYDYQAETNRNYLDIAMAQAGYHGSHHSWNYYWGGFSQEQIDRLSEQIGRTWNGDLWDLSPEEMKVLRSNVDMWKQIQDTGKGGYGGRLTEKLDDYIDQAGKLEELEEQLNESLTQISFDSLYDSFIDTLMDMDASAEEIAGNVGEYFMRAILSNQIGEEYKERLQAWYDDFAEAMKDNDLSQDEIGSLTDSYRDIVEEAVALRDKLAEATGYTGDNGSGTTQSGKSGSFDAMSQEQGTKLEGMFTSGLMHWSSMDEKMSDVSEQMGVAVDSLRRIEENTGNSAKHLGEIKEDIKKIIRDGLKMK